MGEGGGGGGGFIHQRNKLNLLSTFFRDFLTKIIAYFFSRQITTEAFTA